MNPSGKPYAALVIGSGFGGTIMALTLANFFESRNKGRSRANLEEVCVLERGQWWISHEILARPADKRQGEPPDKRNMREYLDDAGQQYAFWAHPDNVEGIVRLASMARQASKRGLYDYRVLSPNVHALTASGVGGGSLVYANVTLKPPAEVYEKWPTEGRGDGLDNYFPRAEEFIGVNKITTVAGLSGQKLARSKAFQDAARAARERLATQKRADGLEIAEPMDGYDLNLSITDLPANLFDGFPLNPGSLTPQQLESYQEVVTKYQSKIQTNVCQRQGRCNLGCVPGARHTLNKRFYLALLKNKPLVVKALHEAVTITYIPGSEFPYRVDCWDYSGGEDSPVLKSIWTKRLVVSAGTLGTVELLKKSVARKGLSLSDRLGQHFSTDGDLLGFMTVLGDKFAFSIEDTGISNMVADLFATSFEFQAAKKANVPFTQRLKLFLRFPGMAPLTLLLGLTPSRLIGVLSKVWTNDLVRSFRLGMVQPESLKAHGARQRRRNTGPLSRLGKNRGEEYRRRRAAPARLFFGEEQGNLRQDHRRHASPSRGRRAGRWPARRHADLGRHETASLARPLSLLVPVLSKPSSRGGTGRPEEVGRAASPWRLQNGGKPGPRSRRQLWPGLHE